MSANKENALDSLLSLIKDQDIKNAIKLKMLEAINYTPRIGVMGKSGKGKSSLINAIMGKQVCHVSDVHTGTKEPEIIHAELRGHKIEFMDLPGIADANEQLNDSIYKMYQDEIKNLDVILWVLQIDDRAVAEDVNFYKQLIKIYDKERILFVLTKADSVAPSHKWDRVAWQPSDKQKENILLARCKVSGVDGKEEGFNVPLEDVIAVSGIYDEDENKYLRYNIQELVTNILCKVPEKAKSSFLGAVDKENRTKEAEEDAITSFTKTTDKILDEVIDVLPIPEVGKLVVKKVKKEVLRGVRKAWKFFFG